MKVDFGFLILLGGAGNVIFGAKESCRRQDDLSMRVLR